MESDLDPARIVEDIEKMIATMSQQYYYGPYLLSIPIIKSVFPHPYLIYGPTEEEMEDFISMEYFREVMEY